ncbi:MAG: prepilin-type N-terminal cleavage/methylation domain-containing protein [Planctomycetota bacterium]|jgi:prepilin-type N-terminal cleavage/methylation domain-containing protein
MSKSQKGLTLIEIMIAMIILVIALLCLVTALLQAMRHDAVTQETILAMNATRGVLEEMRSSMRFWDIFMNYNSDPNDDVDGPGTGPGCHFAVQGLNPRPTDKDGFVGRIEFPGDTEDDQRGILDEMVVDEEMDMPRDLDGSTTVDPAPNRSDFYFILPVRIVIQWMGAGQTTESRYTTFLAPKD